jgi:hypothetical protein
MAYSGYYPLTNPDSPKNPQNPMGKADLNNNKYGLTIWLFNIAMEKTQNKWRFLVSSWENHLLLWAMASMAMLVITRG